MAAVNAEADPVQHGGATEPDPGASPAQVPGDGPGAEFATAGIIRIVTGYQLAMVLSGLYVLIKLLPHPTPAGKPSAAPVSTSEAAAAPTAPAMTDSAATGLRTAESLATAGRSAAARVGAEITGAPGNLACNPNAQRVFTGVDSLLDPECVSIFFADFPLWKQQRLILMILLSGMLGALFRGLGSLALYVGTRMLRRSWLVQYYVQPFRGAVLGLLFYFLFRSGLFSANAGFEATDPVGFMAISMLVGVFEKEATRKLQQIASALFSPHEQSTEQAPDGAGATGTASSGTSSTSSSAASTAAPVIESAEPKQIPAGESSAVISLRGTGLTGVVVHASRDGVPASVRRTEPISATSVQVALEHADLAAPGLISLQAFESSGTRSSGVVVVEVIDVGAPLP